MGFVFEMFNSRGKSTKQDFRENSTLALFAQRGSNMNDFFTVNELAE